MKQIGSPLDQAKVAVLLLHGRGASAQSILALAEQLPQEEVAYFAPQAPRQTWYPYSFLVPIAQNEPHLSAALTTIANAIAQLNQLGVPNHRLIIGGFSQGACLACEFVARHPQRYGGVWIFSGGLIGDQIDSARYTGSLAGTPIFLGCSESDFHIPAERVRASAELLTQLGGNVICKLYPKMGHTINQDELIFANAMLNQLCKNDNSHS